MQDTVITTPLRPPKRRPIVKKPAGPLCAGTVVDADELHKREAS